MQTLSVIPIVTGLLAVAPALGCAMALLALAKRKQEMQRFEKSHAARAQAIKQGSHKARLLHPDIDLSKCIGCGTCVRECPEDGVLDLLHGQAVVVHGARCVGHARCAEACPTGAIALTFADLQGRTDLPAITEEFEAVDAPGIFLAGELTGFSLVRTAVAHGTAVAETIAQRAKANKSALDASVPDLLIVGAGPAGVACALKAKELGLNYQVIEQETALGGTVAAYPRKKMVMTQPMVLPLHGRLGKQEYQKEELVDLWTSLAQEHALKIKTGVKLSSITRDADQLPVAQTSAGPMKARNICLCLGRRGTPRRLGVPGEELPKVQYNLLDAESYKHRHILVVGGGDSAAEAAIGLSEQEGNTVTLCSRDADWVRVKAKNESRIHKAAQSGRLNLLMRSNVRIVEPKMIHVARKSETGAEEMVSLPNDDLFVFAGGEPPFDLLKKAGVSFDPSKLQSAPKAVDNLTPLIFAISALLMLTVAIACWAFARGDYYGLGLGERTLTTWHDFLRPAGKFGLSMGLGAVALFAWNLAYLLRRNPSIGRFLPGSLRFWMGSHVFTGLASFFCVIVHAGFTYRMTVGGFAFLSLGIVLVAGLVGRYFYAIVPHAANGREMDLDELRTKLAGMSATWDKAGRGVGERVRARIETLVMKDRWHASLPARAKEMLLSHFRLRRILKDLRTDEELKDVPPEEREELLALAKQSWKLTLQIAHYEEVRAVLGTWRFIHGWLAVLMVLFVSAHLLTAFRYARLDWPWQRGGAAVVEQAGAHTEGAQQGAGGSP